MYIIISSDITDTILMSLDIFFFLYHYLRAFFLMNSFSFFYSRAASSTSIGTSISVGQKSFFNDLTTWEFFLKPPPLMEWGSILEDPRGDDFKIITGKNKKALNQLYSTVEEAKGINNRSINGVKNAVALMLSIMNVKEITEALHLEDPESDYHALRDANGKQHIEGLAIIFSGSYNHGIPCFPPHMTPYEIVDTRMVYSAVLKNKWRDAFPTVVMMQRNDKIPKSSLDRFLLSNSKKINNNMHASHFTTPNSDRSNSSSCASGSLSIEDYNSYIQTNEEIITHARQLNASSSQLSAIMNEYIIDMSTANECGYALITEIDNSSHGITFNLHATMKDSRSFNGKVGSHQWKVFKEMNIIGKLHVSEGNYVVVLGIRNKKIHVEDPSHPTESFSKIRTFLVDPEYFFFADSIHLSPEST